MYLVRNGLFDDVDVVLHWHPGDSNDAAFIPRSTIQTTNVELIDKVMYVNVRAPMLLIRSALPHLKAAMGSMVNIGSINAYCGESPLLGYSMLKGVLMTMPRNLADSLFTRIGVRDIHMNPGWILTDDEYKLKLSDGLPPDWPGRLPALVAPLIGLIGTDPVANAAIF